MKILNDHLKATVIPALQSGLGTSVFNVYGLIKAVKHGKETIYIELDDDSKSCEGIHPNDKCDYWAAMLCTQIDTTVLRDIGNKKGYLATARVSLIGYSKTFRQAIDYTVSKLASVKNVTITRINDSSYDVLKVISSEKYYNIQHDLFMISFDYTYKTDFCTVDTLTGSEACNVY
jgi:hypothetical protein